MAEYPDREYVILESSDIDSVDFDQIMESSVSSLRYSRDKAYFLVKFEGSAPDFLADKEKYTHYEIKEILDNVNGSMKPVDEDGLTLAAWVKLTDDESDGAGIYNTLPVQRIFGCKIAGGFSLSYQQKRFAFDIRLQDGSGTLQNQQAVSDFATMRLFTSNQVDKALYKSDGWHFVVGTWDGNRVTQIYVDGGRSLGFTLGVEYGSMIEDSDSKKTAAAPTGNNPSGNNKWLGGYLGDMCQWNRELTSAEIDTLYNYHKPIDMSTMHPNDICGYYRAKDVSGTSWPAYIGSFDITLGQAMTVNPLVPSLDVQTVLGGGYA